MRQRIQQIAVSALVVFGFGCGCGVGPDSSGKDADDGPPEATDNAVPSEEVRVMGGDARRALSEYTFDPEANVGTLRFDASSDFAQGIEQDEILASRPVEGRAPAGMLQRVTSVERQEDTIVVTARQATLAETFQSADIDLEREISAEDVQRMQELRPGVTFRTRRGGLGRRKQAVGKSFEMNFEKVVLDGDGDESTTDDQLKLDGRVSFGVSFDGNIKIKGFKLKRFLFAVDIDESANLQVTGNYDESNFGGSKEIADVDLETLTYKVAGVPVSIDVDLTVTIGIEGTIRSEIQVSAEHSGGLRAGAKYKKGDGWSVINDPELSFNVPTPSFNLTDTEARAWIEPKLDLKIYGVDGAFVAAKPYLQIQAERYSSPFWRFWGGLNVAVDYKLKVPVVGKVGGWDKDFTAFERTIAKSSNQPPTLDVERPDDGVRLETGDNLRIVARANDREQKDVPITLVDGDRTVEETSTKGGTVSFTLHDLCEGTKTVQLRATDGTGATDSATISASVSNGTPEVEIDETLLTGKDAPPVFPGGYMTAGASVTDSRCSDAPRVNPDLIEWYLDGNRIGSSPELLHWLPPDKYQAGDTITVQAAYDDGQSVGRSSEFDVTLQSEPAGETSLYAQITYCSVCTYGVVVFGDGTYSSNEVTLRGRGLVPKEGEVAANRLVWKLRKGDGTVVKLGRGEEITFEMDKVYSDPRNALGTQTVILEVEDASGGTADTTEKSFEGKRSG